MFTDMTQYNQYFQDMHTILCSSDFGAPYGDFEKKNCHGLFSAPMGDRSKILNMNIHLYEYFQDTHEISRSSEFGAPFGVHASKWFKGGGSKQGLPISGMCTFLSFYRQEMGTLPLRRVAMCLNGPVEMCIILLSNAIFQSIINN